MNETERWSFIGKKCESPTNKTTTINLILCFRKALSTYNGMIINVLSFIEKKWWKNNNSAHPDEIYILIFLLAF